MPLERNLFPNPALANNATGWISAPSGYARSTSIDAALPRTTGIEGSVAGDVNTPRALVSGGQQYVFSVSIAAQSAQTFGMLVNFYDGTTGGAFLGNSGATVPVNLSAGQSARFVLGPYTAPTGTQSCTLKFNDIDAGGCEITAVRCAPYSGDVVADGLYFDGASPGAVWDGTAGDSTSSRRLFVETVTTTDTFNRVSTALGPVATDTATAVDAFTGVASGTVLDNAYAVDGFLIAQLEYDEERGRVRVSAFTFADTVTRVRVRRRSLPNGNFEDVRGGTVDAVGGFMVRPVDDYEYPAGVNAEYEIVGLTDNGQEVQRSTLRRNASNDKVWLKFVANPQLNRRVDLVGWGEVARKSRAEIFEVVGAKEPVMVTDVFGSRSVTVEFVTHTPEDTKALDDALSEGFPIFFQVPVKLQLPTLYASVGDYSYKALTPSSVRSRWTVPLREVAAPPASVIVGSTRTYADGLADYPTYAQSIAAKSTYRELLIA